MEKSRNSISGLFRNCLAARSSDNAKRREEENFWRMRGDGEHTAWLFNAIANKHADAVDNLPAPFVLPKEKEGEEAAGELSKILPAIYEEAGFEKTWSDVWYDKLKHGTGCYGVFWDPGANDGRGGVRVERIDVSALCWEPGVSDIQDAEYVFYSKIKNINAVKEMFPYAEIPEGDPFGVFPASDGAPCDMREKVVVTDFYYKGVGSEICLLKFCGDEILYDSTEERAAPRGIYDHGLFPFFFDPLYPIRNSPCGFGLIETMKDTQRQIDRLTESLTKSAELSAKTRYFIRTDGAVNEEEFSDFTKPFVHVQGSRLGDDSIRQIDSPGVDSSAFSILKHKIDELKETVGNRDFSQGGTASGVTAASAIAALQEAGNKLSRDMIAGSYEVFRRMTLCVIELLRQFCKTPRIIRVEGEDGYEFVRYSSESIAPRDQIIHGRVFGPWAPSFDVKVSAEKRSPITRVTQNDMAKEFFAMGLFDPARRAQALTCVSMMDFEGKDKLIKALSEQTGAGVPAHSPAPAADPLASAVRRAAENAEAH